MMKTRTCYLAIFVGMLLIFMGACSQPTEITVTPEPTATPVPTDTPTPTPVPTSTPTPTLEPTPTPIPAAQFISEGDALLFASDWEGAIAAYEEAIALHDDPFAHAHLAYAYYYQAGLEEEALAEARLAMEGAPDDAEANAYLAKMLLANHQYEEAVKAAEIAVELDEENALAMAALSESYLATNRHDEALEAAEQAVALNPDTALTHIQLADVLATAANYEEAITAADDAYVLGGEFIPVMISRAKLYDMVGDDVTESSLLNRALTYDPNYVPALVNKAFYHSEEGEYEQALDLCDQVVDLEPDLPDGYDCRGYVYLDRDFYEDAIENFDAAIERDVEWSDGYFGRGQVFLEQDDCGGSRTEFEKVISLRPYAWYGQAFLGLSDICDGSYSAAIEKFQQASEMNPNYAISRYGLGLAYMGEERYEDAVVEFETAVDLAKGSSAMPNLGLGSALVELERDEEAEAAFLAAKELEPNDLDVLLALGDFYLDHDRYNEAREQFERILDINDTSVPALVGIGFSLAMQERCGLALTYFDQARDLDPENELAKDFYSQCYKVYRYENPPGPQGDPLGEGAAITVATDAVISRLGLGGQDVIAEFSTEEGDRLMFVGYLASFDPDTQPNEFTNQINQAMFAAVDAFVRADSSPLYLVVQAFAIQNGEVVMIGIRSVHRTDAVDWWNGNMSDGAFIGTWQ